MRSVACMVLALVVLASVGCGSSAPSTPPATSASTAPPPAGAPPAPGAPPPPGATPAPNVAAGVAPPANPAVGDGATRIDPLTGQPLVPTGVPAAAPAANSAAANALLQPDDQRQGLGAWTMRLPASLGTGTTTKDLGPEFGGLISGKAWVRSPPELNREALSLAVISSMPPGIPADIWMQQIYGNLRGALPLPDKLTDAPLQMSDGRTVTAKTASGAGPMKNPTSDQAPSITGQAQVYFVPEGGQVLTLVWCSTNDLATKENFLAASQEAMKSLKFSGQVAQAVPPAGQIDPQTGRPVVPLATNGPPSGEMRIDPLTGRPIVPGAVVPGVPIDPQTGRPAVPLATNGPVVAPQGDARIDPQTGRPFVPGDPSNPAGAAPATIAPDDYAGLATQAFREGRENDAMHYLFALSLVKPDDGDSRKNMKLVPALKRSTAAVRFGIGFFYNAPRGFSGNPQQVVANTGGGPGQAVGRDPVVGQPPPPQGGGQPNVPGVGGPDQARQMLVFFTGELGEKIAEGLAARIDEGVFGLALQEAAKAHTAGGGAAQPQPQLGGDPNAGQLRGGGAHANMSLFPGLTVLGMGDAKELQERAAREGIDALLLFNVIVKPVSKGGHTTSTTYKLIDVARRSEVYSGREVSTLAVAAARDPKSKAKENPLDVSAEKFFEFVDGNLKMTELPLTLTPESISKRAAQLTASKTEDPLPVLAELQFYHMKNLIDKADREAAFKAVAGDAGVMLTSGDADKAKQAVSTWLPKTGAAGGGRRTLLGR